jgi:hypothetical protein
VFVFTLTEAYRGEEAWQRIVAANQFNDPPPAGMEYLLLYAEVEYVEGPGDETLRLDAWAFRLVTDNQVLTPPAVVDPEPAFEFEFFPGGAAGGWMSWTVYEDDAAPLLGYGLEYDGSGGTYFVAGP